jgi:hypothetical protein
MNAKQTMLFTNCAFLVFLATKPASAQTDSPEPAQARPAAPTVKLTPQQLESFSELTGDGQNLVFRRLSTNPGMVSLAAAAADARSSRRSSGKAMAIIGFTILGIGDIAASYILLTTPGYPKIESGHENRIFLSAGIALGSIAVGLALAIPGLIKMARQTKVEDRAMDAYSPGWRDVSLLSAPTSAPQVHVLGKTVTTPVWAFTF